MIQCLFALLALSPKQVLATFVRSGSTDLEVSCAHGPSAPCSYSDSYPRQYVSYKTSDLKPDRLDGDLTKQVWADVPWTDDFEDISTTTEPRLRTRAKIRWDDDYLYIAAELEETETWATLTQDNTVIFHDNDFEAFVDPAGSRYFYKEYEMNAFNAKWTLCLNRPYGNGGYENSSRVFGDHGFSLAASSSVQLNPLGVIDDPLVRTNHWTVEIAMPIDKIMYNNTQERPKHGSFWRINFSRVQWHLKVNATTGKFYKAPSCQSCPVPGTAAEDNWVWQRQGAIAMHLPEHWGILQFSDAAVNSTPMSHYAEWPSRSAAMALYDAQQEYASKHTGQYSSSFEELKQHATHPERLCDAAETKITLSSDAKHFQVMTISPASPDFAATVTSEGLLTVTPTAKLTSV